MAVSARSRISSSPVAPTCTLTLQVRAIAIIITTINCFIQSFGLAQTASRLLPRQCYHHRFTIGETASASPTKHTPLPPEQLVSLPGGSWLCTWDSPECALLPSLSPLPSPWVHRELRPRFAIKAYHALRNSPQESFKTGLGRSCAGNRLSKRRHFSFPSSLTGPDLQPSQPQQQQHQQ